MMEVRGQVANWNDDKGFGFIKPAGGGEPVFLHIGAMRGLRRPVTGDEVLYLAGKDAQGRWRAEHARFDELSLDRPAIRRKPRPSATPAPSTPSGSPRGARRGPHDRAGSGVRGLPGKLALLVALCGLPLAGSLNLLQAYGLVWPLLAYALFSVISFLQYWRDKHRAQKGAWRTPENTLHLIALLGGWPGALVAQQVFRHKTRKLSFQLVCWSSVLLHQVFWFDWLWQNGRWFGAAVRGLLP